MRSSSSDNYDIVEQAFQILQVAANIEKEQPESSSRKVESAKKYLEACFLFQKYVDGIEQQPQLSHDPKTSSLDPSSNHGEEKGAKRAQKDKLSSNAKKKLLLKNIAHYENHAIELIRTNTDDSVAPPQSPLVSPLVSPLANPPPPSTLLKNMPPILTRSTLRSPSSQSSSSSSLLHLIEKANAKLSQALDFDEQGNKKSAIEEYTSAAETFLAGLRIIKKGDSDLRNMIKRRLQGVIDRVEELKTRDTEKKNQPDVTSKNDKLANNSAVRSPNGTKTLPDNVNKTLNARMDCAIPKDGLSPAEIEVLKQSSLIASGLFMPWCAEEIETFPFYPKISATTAGNQANDVSYGNNTFPWRDGKGPLQLSNLQKQHFYKWARPSEIVQMKNGPFYEKKPKMVHAISPYSIRQKYVTDCSFIASLIICAAFERRFKRRLITSIIYPQDDNGNPIYNPHGRYLVRLWLNGVARRVQVDDFFPVDKFGNILCSYTHCKSAMELWVCVIEKAYMKLCGGYDFPGSNSGVDLFALTGWIPEQIYFPEDPSNIQDFETPPDRAWKRLLSASSFGDCLITVACDTLSDEEANQVGLVTGHAYAVLKVVESKNGEKLLQVKNPWANKSWKGKYSSIDSQTWSSNPDLGKELGYDPFLHQNIDDGIFWICWDDVLCYFQNLHLSWNPALFSSHITIHGSWPASIGPKDDSFNIGDNPQYILTLDDEAIDKKASIWILLSRHVTKQEQEGSTVTQFLSLHINRNKKSKERLYYPNENRVLTGAYLNNPHVLVRYDITSPEDKYLTLVLSQFEKSADLNYTLSCFCTSPFSLGKPTKPLSNKDEIKSEWTEETAGGSPNSLTGFSTNPMWKISIPHGGSKIQLQCRATKTLAINLVMFQGSVKKKSDVMRMGDATVLDSGAYRPGFVVTNVQFIPDSGDYTLVASTYEKEQVGKFVLSIFSSEKLTVESIV